MQSLLHLDFWVDYLFGALIACNLMAAWFHTNFAQHVWNATHRNGNGVETKDDLIIRAVSLYPVWGDLWICPICFGTWLSVFLSTGLWVAGAPAEIILAGTFSWPFIFYVWHRK